MTRKEIEALALLMVDVATALRSPDDVALVLRSSDERARADIKQAIDAAYLAVGTEEQA